MATQFTHSAYRDFPIQTQPPSNIRVAFIAGPATVAANEAVAKLPEGEARSTLDELALANAISDLIKAAQEKLSAPILAAFFQWASASTYFTTRWEDDAESAARCRFYCDARDKLLAEPAATIHDLAVKAYIEIVEKLDLPPIGPRDYSFDDGVELIDIGKGLLWEIAGRSELPDLIDAMAWLAWRQSTRTAFTEAVGFQIMRAFQDAPRNADSQENTSVAAVWREAHDSYQQLNARAKSIPGTGRDGDEADQRVTDAIKRIIYDVRTPDLQALHFKLKLAFEWYPEDEFSDFCRDAILNDVEYLLEAEFVA